MCEKGGEGLGAEERVTSMLLRKSRKRKFIECGCVFFILFFLFPRLKFRIAIEQLCVGARLGSGFDV